MSAVKILGETEDTVTISRDDWKKLLEQLEDARDLTAIAERRGREHRVGKEAARRDYLNADEAIALLDGESPVRVWRRKRGLSQRALAAAAGIGGSYLAEIETNRKPGSAGAYRKLAAVLRVPAEDLDPRRYRTRDPHYGPVALLSSPASAGVAPGNRGAWADRIDFSSLLDALDFVRVEWSALRSRAPWIADHDHWPIYTVEELVEEIEG